MSVWKGAISFGLVYIPVIMETAQQDQPLSFTTLDKRNFAPVGYKHYNKKTGEEVSREDIVKGYEYEKNNFALVTDEELKSVARKKSEVLQIEDFVEVKEIDPILFYRPYFLVPQKGVDHNYHLLRRALEKTKKIGIGSFVLRTKPHLAAVMAKGDYLVLELLNYPHTILEAREADFLDKDPQNIKIPSKEMDMAVELVEMLSSSWKPDKYQDTYYQEVMELIEKKIKSGKTKVSLPEEELAAREEVEGLDRVYDLMPLLKKSLEKSKGKGKKKTSNSKKKKATKKRRRA